MLLNGAPGIFSARYAGAEADDSRIPKNCFRDESFAKKDRKARFVCSIALAMPEGNVRTFNGYTKEALAPSQRGFNGFGYDPVFYLKGMIGHLQK